MCIGMYISLVLCGCMFTVHLSLLEFWSDSEFLEEGIAIPQLCLYSGGAQPAAAGQGPVSDG